MRRVFPEVFGKSKFFDEQSFELVLRARTVLDELSTTEELVADLATVAVLASLLTSSRMIRSGDIRYRNENELGRQTSIEDEVGRRLAIMANDLAKLSNPPEQPPVLAVEDARKLRLLPSMEVDLVVTSPPYLNGTNYFRNTKIELWFLRSLRSKERLADFRFRAVTAGINDVTVDKVRNWIPEPIEDVLAVLEEDAYDSRIPRMVLNYFQDMELIFSGMRKHLVDGANLAVDLGDSVYGGVHVPTDRLLVEILQQHGFVQEDHVVLRKRLSRDRTELHQVLLVFRYNEQKQTRSVDFGLQPTQHKWRDSWFSLQKELPHQKRPYSKRNWGNALHSICSYQGKMKPALAYHLVQTFVPSDGRMLDPFSGVGTIPFEAALNGVTSYGFEISPAALAISAAKLSKFDGNEAKTLIAKLKDYLEQEEPTEDEYERAEAVAFNGSIPEYFHPKTLREILLARRFFQEGTPETGTENLVYASLLHILHGNRPYALSRRSQVV